MGPSGLTATVLPLPAGLCQSQPSDHVSTMRRREGRGQQQYGTASEEESNEPSEAGERALARPKVVQRGPSAPPAPPCEPEQRARLWGEPGFVRGVSTGDVHKER